MNLLEGNRIVMARCCCLIFAINAALNCLHGPSVVADDGTTTTIRVMSMNMWHGGDAGRQPFGQTVAVVRSSKADIVGLQETEGGASDDQSDEDNAARLAKQLGWHYFNQGDRTAIISRFPIVAPTPRKWGVELKLPSGQSVYMFNAHLAHAPYQPYQLLNIPYADADFLTTADQAVAAARKARGAQVASMLAEIQGVINKAAVFVTGDFNEPSHLDWTVASANAGNCPLAVQWPSTKAVCDAGFRDAFRTVYPDPIQEPGLTWTTLTKIDDPSDHHDRIDFVFGNALATAKRASVVGESPQNAAIVVTPYPSDHRSVVAEFEIDNRSAE